MGDGDSDGGSVGNGCGFSDCVVIGDGGGEG